MKSFNIAASFAALVVSQPAQAEDWWIINAEPDHVSFADVSTLITSGNTRTIWTRMDFRDTSGGLVYTASRERFDCVEKSQVNLAATDYDADDEPKFNRGQQAMKFARPGTNLRYVIDNVCSLTPDVLRAGENGRMFRLKDPSDLRKIALRAMDFRKAEVARLERE